MQLDSAERARKRLKNQEPTPEIVYFEDHPGVEEIVAANSDEITIDINPDSNDATKSQESGTQTRDTGRLRCRATDYISNSKLFNFFTGLEEYSLFKLIFAYFGPAVNELNYYYGTVPAMDPEDQFYLVLMKLRQAKCNVELSALFSISEKDCTNIFVTWINFLYLEFKELCVWPSRELVSFYAPTNFKRTFPSTRVVIDGTEIPIQRPKQPSLQQATCSTYKNRNTVKVLVGVTPAGMVSYISDVYGGSASDRQISERSALVTMCEPGDSIMSDKGFKVQDLFIPAHVTVNIPEFFKKKNRMSGKRILVRTSLSLCSSPL